MLYLGKFVYVFSLLFFLRKLSFTQVTTATADHTYLMSVYFIIKKHTNKLNYLEARTWFWNLDDLLLKFWKWLQNCILLRLQISGIGPVQGQILNAMGINTCSDLWSQRDIVECLFTPISVDFYMRVAKGIGRTTVKR